MSFFSNKRILVTGVSGTVGSEILNTLINDPYYQPDEIIGVDQNESEIFFLDQFYSDSPIVNFYVLNIRDREGLTQITKGIDIILHTAALKHVILCERSPMEAIQSNIIGVENVIHAARQNEVRNVLFTSSDKAVNPTNVMGTSKLMGERLITAANSTGHEDGPIFSSTRFGNVLGSSGSVIPVFHRQIKRGGPVTLTDVAMSRFVMSIEQAVRLVLDTVELALGGEVFITKMPVARIADLATVMIAELAERYDYNKNSIDLEIIGSKPGEKLYEELMSEEETRRSIELDRYFVVLPAFRGLYRKIDYTYRDVVSMEVNDPYNSSKQEAMPLSELGGFLNKHNLLESI